MAKKSKSKPAPTPPKTSDSAGPERPHPLQKAADAASGQGVGRWISLAVLVGVVVVIGIYFFKVMASFLVPLFLAAVLAVVFKPLHTWSIERTNGRKELAALLTTALISLLVVVPTAVLGWMAYVETTRVVRVLLIDDDETTTEEPASRTAPTGDDIVSDPNDDPLPTEDAESPTDAAAADDSWVAMVGTTAESLFQQFQEAFGNDLDSSQLARSGAQYVVSAGLLGVQALISAAIGVCIMVFAMYYFFADGPSIIDSLMHLSPLDDKYEIALLGEFAAVSRAVVLATLLSAVVQGLLGGVGYFFVLDDWTPPAVAAQYADHPEDVPRAATIRPPVVLLTVATMLLAIVPFVGATAVWIPVTLWVYFVQGDLWPAIGMAIYGTAVVSSIDNVIKPLVLHGQSNLHPLLALLSVLGGIQVLGPVGILVGPMLAAFMQALLGMLRQELDRLQREETPATDSA